MNEHYLTQAKFIFFSQLNDLYNPNNVADLIKWYSIDRNVLEKYPYVYTYMANFNIITNYHTVNDYNYSYTILCYFHYNYNNSIILPLYKDCNSKIICCLSKVSYYNYIHSMKYLADITAYIQSIDALNDLKE